jgi:hypothetical protein
MAPTELAHHHIATIVVCLAHCDRVVTALAVILRVFFFGSRLEFFAGRGRRRARSGFGWSGTGAGRVSMSPALMENITYDSVGVPSLVTMGFKSVPFLLFLPPLPLAAEAATLAICLPLLSIALVRSTPSMVWRFERERRGTAFGLGGGWSTPSNNLYRCW